MRHRHPPEPKLIEGSDRADLMNAIRDKCHACLREREHEIATHVWGQVGFRADTDSFDEFVLEVIDKIGWQIEDLPDDEIQGEDWPCYMQET